MIFFLVCTLNVHRRCVKNVANNCGINPREMADKLRSCGLNLSKNVVRYFYIVLHKLFTLILLIAKLFVQDQASGNGSFSVSSTTGSGGLHRDLSQQSVLSSHAIGSIGKYDKHSSNDKKNSEKMSKRKIHTF